MKAIGYLTLLTLLASCANETNPAVDEGTDDGAGGNSEGPMDGAEARQPGPVGILEQEYVDVCRGDGIWMIECDAGASFTCESNGATYQDQADEFRTTIHVVHGLALDYEDLKAVYIVDPIDCSIHILPQPSWGYKDFEGSFVMYEGAADTVEDRARGPVSFELAHTASTECAAHAQTCRARKVGETCNLEYEYCIEPFASPAE
jgi:hypothetical protein